MNGDNITYFDRLGVEHIPKELKKFVGTKNIKIIFRIQAHNSVISRYIFIVFIGVMLKGKTLSEYTNYQKIDKIIPRYFQ